MRSGINIVDDLKKKRPFFLGVDCFDPHEPLDAPHGLPGRSRRPARASRRAGHHADPAVRDALLVGDRHGRSTTETIELVRELYAAEITFADEWIGRLMNQLADQKLLDETVVYLLVRPRAHARRARDRRQARRAGPVAHLPRAAHDPAPRGQARGAAERLLRLDPRHLARRSCRSWASGAPGLMTGEDLSVLFDGKRPPRAAPLHLLLRRLRARRRPRLVPALGQRGPPQAALRPDERPARAARRGRPAPGVVDELWRILSDEAGGTLPQFSRHRREGGARRMSLTRRSLLRRGGAGGRRRGACSARSRAPRRRPRSSATTARAERVLDRAAARARRPTWTPSRAARHAEDAEPGRPDRGTRCASTARSPSPCRRSPARRALVTGMRSFPFRDWRRHDGLPVGARLQPGLGPPAAADRSRPARPASRPST